MGKIHQLQTAVTCSSGLLVIGLLTVWPSYTLSQYTSQNTTLLSAPMTELESSLIGSLPSLGSMIGTGVCSLLMDVLGRKKAGLAITLPFVLSWAIVAVTTSSLMILIARFLGGIAGGALLVYAPIFISEISEDSIRGALTSGPIMFYCLGVLISYLLGWFLSYHTIIWANLFASVVSALLFLFVTESPVYLLKQNREEDACAALARYRGATPGSKVVLEEFSKLKHSILSAVELVPISNADSDSKVEDTEKEKLYGENNIPEERPKMSPLTLLFVSPSSRRAFIVVGFVLSTQIFMGMMPIQIYSKDLFSQAAPNLSSHFCSVLFAVVLLCGSLVSAVIADVAGRRVLLISSSVLVAVCMVGLGLLLQTSAAPAWVTALMMLVYCFSFNLGVGTVPFVLLAECFVPEVQGLASMMLVEWVWLLNFMVIALFPLMSKIMGIHGLFYIFASVGAFSAIMSFFIVPETKGLSNERIQEILLRSRKK